MSGPGPAWQCLYSAGPVLLVQPAAAQPAGPAGSLGPSVSERAARPGGPAGGPGPGPASPAGAPSCHCPKAAESDGHRQRGRTRPFCLPVSVAPCHGPAVALRSCHVALPPGPRGPRPGRRSPWHGVTGHPGDRVGPLTQPVSLSEALTTTTSTASPGPGRACRSGGRARPGAQSRAGSRPQAGRTRTVSDRLRLESTVATAFST